MMNKLIFIFATLLSTTVLAGNWTTPQTVTSIGQYGMNKIHFTLSNPVSSCGDGNKLFYVPSDFTNPDEFYSALIAAYAAKKKIKVILVDPLACGGEGNKASRIKGNYFYISD